MTSYSRGGRLFEGVHSDCLVLLAVQCAMQRFQGGRGRSPGSSMGWSSKAAKRKRSDSKSQRPAKRKRTQTGGFSGLFKKFKKWEDENCQPRKQTGGTGRKRKSRKQTGG